MDEPNISATQNYQSKMAQKRIFQQKDFYP